MKLFTNAGSETGRVIRSAELAYNNDDIVAVDD